MLRFANNTRAIHSLCRSLSNQMNKRYQSKGTSSNVALEPDASGMSVFSGHIKGSITHKLEIIRPENITPLTMYQVLDSDGQIKDASHTPDV